MTLTDGVFGVCDAGQRFSCRGSYLTARCACFCHAWGETNASFRAPALAVAPPCQRCGGRLILDREDNDLVCIICGRSRERPWEQEQRTANGKSRRRDPSYMGVRL